MICQTVENRWTCGDSTRDRCNWELPLGPPGETASQEKFHARLNFRVSGRNLHLPCARKISVFRDTTIFVCFFHEIMTFSSIFFPNFRSALTFHISPFVSRNMFRVFMQMSCQELSAQLLKPNSATPIFRKIKHGSYMKSGAPLEHIFIRVMDHTGLQCCSPEGYPPSTWASVPNHITHSGVAEHTEIPRP